MDGAGSLVSYWYYHLPNFIMAALMYTVLGRALLGLVVADDSKNYIWRFFVRFTDPVVGVFAAVTPKATAPVVLWLFTFVWLFWIRVIFHITLLSFDLAPRMSGGAS